MCRRRSHSDGRADELRVGLRLGYVRDGRVWFRSGGLGREGNREGKCLRSREAREGSEGQELEKLRRLRGRRATRLGVTCGAFRAELPPMTKLTAAEIKVAQATVPQYAMPL
mgnify:CR=1 FL=1